MTRPVAVRSKRKRSGFVHFSHQDLQRAVTAAVEPLERRVMLSSTPSWLDPNSAATWDSSSHVLTVTGSATIIADPGSDDPQVTVNGSAAALTIEPTSDKVVQLGSLTLSNGGCAEVTRPDGEAFDPSSSLIVVIGASGAANSVLSIDSTDGSTLGLEDNHLLVHQGMASESNYIVGLTVQSAGMNSSDSLDPTAYEQDAMPIAGSSAAQQLSVAGQSLPVQSGDVLIGYDDVGNASEQPASDFQAPGPAVPMGMFGRFTADDSSDNSSEPISGTTPAEVSSVVVNGNIPSLSGPQRSMVDSIQYTFSEPVTLNSSNAFSIAVASGQSGTVPTLSWSAVSPDDSGASAQWVVTFSGNGVVGTSIADGVYDITLNTAAVTSEANPGVPAQPHNTDTFFRLFGDINGDGLVNSGDNFQFRRALTTYNAAFDYNNDGAINTTDSDAFNARVGTAFTGLISFNPAAQEPTDVSAVANSATSVTISWTAPANGVVSGYRIQYWSVTDNAWEPLIQNLPATPTTYTVTADPDTTYEYQIATEATGRVSDWSESSNDVTTPVAPPLNLTAAQVTAFSVLLTWTGQQGFTYNVYRADQTNPIATGLTATSYLDQSVSPSSSYSYSVTSIDASGNETGSAATLSVTTPAAPFGTTPLPAPSDLSVTNVTDYSVTLQWGASTDANGGITYAIARDGVVVGGTTQTTWTDTGLSLDTAYDYTVTAYDAQYNASSPASLSQVATLDDTSIDIDGSNVDSVPTDVNFQAASVQPTAVTSDSISLSWLPADGEAPIDHYNVYCVPASPTSQSMGTPVGQPSGADYKITGLSDATAYYIEVTAVDAYGREWGSAPPITIDTADATSQQVDYASEQDLPSQWSNYFYNTLLPAARQLWANMGYPSYGPPDFGTSSFLNYEDDAIWYNGQPAALPSETSEFLVVDSSTVPIPPPALIQGIGGEFAYRDVNGYSTYSVGDPIWDDTNGDNKWEPGEPILYQSSSYTLQPGDWGNKDDLYYYNIDGDPNRQIVWAATLHETGFEWDFADLYSSLDHLATQIPDPSGYGAMNIGGFLSQVDDGPAVGTGGVVTVDSIADHQYTITVSGVPADFEFYADDQIQLGNEWYPVVTGQGNGPIAIDTDGNYSYTGDPGTYPLAVRNWTLVPQQDAISGPTDSTNAVPALSYLRGQPLGWQTSVLFPQQFSELRDVIQAMADDVPVDPSDQWAAPVNIPAPGNWPLPLTSQMDLENVVPDSNLDGIVQVPANFDSIAQETGSIQFDSQRDGAQTYLPIYTSENTALPIHAYLTQGAFSAAQGSAQPLLDDSTGWTNSPDAGQQGQPFAYSLDETVRVNLYLNYGDVHIKRMEVVRPGGNVVVFDFPWDSSLDAFNPIGTPFGWNGRDSNRTYVLRDTTVGDEYPVMYQTYYIADTYELEFASGIIHEFYGGYYLGVSEIIDTTSGLYAYMSLGRMDLTYIGGSQIPTGAFDPSIQWNDGMIDGVAYASTSDPSEVISTSVQFWPGTFTVKSLDKVQMVGGASVGTLDNLSYSESDSQTILFGGTSGVQVARSGSIAGGTVTVKTTVTGTPSFEEETDTLNSDGLVLTDTITLSEDGSATSTATTAYTYLASRDRFSNGAPEWSKVSSVTMPNQQWEQFTYDDPETGWVTAMTTPYQSGAPGSDDVKTTDYIYDASVSGDGVPADPDSFGGVPREVINLIEGVQTSAVFYRFGSFVEPSYYDYYTDPTMSGDDNNYETMGVTLQALLNNDERLYSEGENAYVMRYAPSLGGTWATGALQAEVVHTGYQTQLVESAQGDSVNYVGIDYYTGNIWNTVSDSWLGTLVGGESSTSLPQGAVLSSSSGGLGSPYMSDNSTAQDPFGRSTADTLANGQTTTADYSDSDGGTSWFGPTSVTGADGSVTDYTYTPLGQIATKTIYAGSNHSIEYSYIYDAAGNMVKQTQTPVNASGTADGTPLVTTYAYDAQGRLTKEVDNAGGTDVTANRTTTYDYAAFDGTYNTTTVTYPDGSTQITKTYLDGTTASVSGTAATPETDSEGVVSQDTTDANGKIETAGSTWTMTATNGGADWTTTYTNMLGQAYLVQQSTPTGSANPYVDSTTTYNANGQAIETVDFNGTATYTIYDPITGQVGATWVDVNGDGVYTPGVDTKTVYTPTPFAYNASTPAGMDTTVLSASGVQDDDQLTWNGGLNSSDTVDGMTTSTQTIYNGNGSYTVLTTNPDGTQIQDIYTDGLLTEEDQLDSGEGLIAKTTYTYNGMRQLATQTDNTGTTVYAYFQDGTQKSVTPPGQPATTVNALDSGTEDPTNVTNPDGSTTSQTENGFGETLTQSGADVLGATYGYNGNGQITSLTTAAGTTNWAYDPDTGALQSETFADGTSDTYQYNADGQMTNVTEPGMTGTFRYDAYGDLTDSTYMDSATGLVQSTVNGEDDQGRPVVTTDTDNGQTSTETDAYNSLGDLQSETFGSAGNTSVSYGYYGAGATAGSNGGDSDALQSLTASTPGGQSVSQSYTYDSAGRLASITVNGIVISYSYAPNSDQVETIGASPTGANLGDDFVNETYSPDPADGSRLSSISVGAGNSQSEGEVYDAGYAYNNDDRIASDQTTQTDANGNATSQTLNYTYNPNEADALTQVTDGSGNVLYNYAYDGTGNFSGNLNLGTANNIDEYSNLSYNARHDLTNDGTYAYGYDALDRLISITPDNPTSGMLSAQYGYDDQGRMLWENVYGYTGSAWGLYTTYHYVWSGDELIEKLDGNNNVLQQYTWGPGWDGQDQVIALTDYTQGSPTTYLLSYDASGNVTMLLNPAAGQVVANYTYTPYGALASATGPAAGINPFLGKGYWTDAAVNPNLGWAQPDTADGTTRETDFPLSIWLQNDPTGFNGGLNPTSVDGNDPVDNVDPDGTTYKEIVGVAGVRWNEAEGHAEFGLAVVIHPSLYNYVFGVSDTDRDAPVSVQWVPINSLPKEYASVAGLDRLANWDKQPIRDQSAPSILVNVAFELARQEAVQQAMTAGLNAAGPTGLGPTGEGLATGVLLEALTSIVKVARTAQTAEELRNVAGTATVSQELAPASGRWLEADRPAPIPAQVAQKLKGQQFNSFADLRAAIWKTIAADPELTKSFSPANIANMRQGNAPFAPRQFQVNASDAGMRFNLHHVRPIESGGSVYDLGNLQIVSPAVHTAIHS